MNYSKYEGEKNTGNAQWLVQLYKFWPAKNNVTEVAVDIYLMEQ